MDANVCDNDILAWVSERRAASALAQETALQEADANGITGRAVLPAGGEVYSNLTTSNNSRLL